MTLKAGQLRHRIKIEKISRTQDANTLELKDSWITHADNVPAHVSDLSTRELLAAQAIQSQVSARITIRHRTDIDASMRIVFRGKVYDIAGLISDNVSGLEYLTIPVSQGVNQG